MSVSNTYQVKVDIKKKPTTKAPEVIANDKVVFEVEVFDNGTLFPLDESYIYYLVSKSYKKDANAVIRQGTLTNGKIVFALGSSEFEHIGKVEATVQIFDSTNKRVSTAYFDYKVEKDNSFEGELPNDEKNLVIVNESVLNSKATKIELQVLQTTVNNIGNASPKGTYATLTALQSAFPNGTTGIYVVTADGNWYYWNGSAWTSGGTYQSTGIADKSITEQKTSFINSQLGKNLLNDNPFIVGDMNLSTGVVTPNESSVYIYSPKVKVEPMRVIRYGQYHIQNNQYVLKTFNRVFKYAQDGSYIGYDEVGTSANSYTVPSNTYEVVLRGPTASYDFINFRYAIEYDNLTTYEPYKLEHILIPQIKVSKDSLPFDYESFVTAEDVQNVIDGDIKNISCFGDSLTDGSGAGGDSNNYPTRLGVLLGSNYTVYNFGIGGEGSRSIAMRQGGIPLYVNPFTIPSTMTPVNIELPNSLGYPVSLFRRGGASVDANYSKLGINPCIINGVEGTLNRPDINQNIYTFTRSAVGSEVVVSRPAFINTLINRTRMSDIAIIWVGTNDTSYTAEQIIQVQEYMIENLKHDKYIIIGLTAKNYHSDIVDKNNAMMKKWGKKFLNIRDYILEYGLDDAGIVPTSQDTTAISNGEIPPSLVPDGTHFNAKGYQIIATLVYKKGLELGYW